MKVTVIGAGYVGLTAALALAYTGHDVAVVEKDREKLEILREGRSPLYEKGLDELLKIVREDMEFTEGLGKCVPSADIAMISAASLDALVLLQLARQKGYAMPVVAPAR